MSDHLLSALTVCGLAELDAHTTRSVTDVLTILDPDMADSLSFAAWPAHRRTILRFHDEIEPRAGVVLPEQTHIDAILAYGRAMCAHPGEKHLLVHCHMGMSRSTAAMVMLLAQEDRATSAEDIIARVHKVRQRSWPNSLMMRMADETLGRNGALTLAMRRLYGRQLVSFPTLGSSLRAIGRGAEVDMAIPA